MDDVHRIEAEWMKLSSDSYVLYNMDGPSN